MGRSEPPFIYDRPTTYSFYGPSDPAFNPKAVTQASRARPPPRPTQKGPLVNINRHPDSVCRDSSGTDTRSIVTNNSLQWGSLDSKTTWTPMSPQTKNRVNFARRTQLVLRVFTLLGALGSLFCSIVINNVATTVIWIIRAGVSDAAQTRLDLTANCFLAHCCNSSYSLWHLPSLSLSSEPAPRFAS
jgi:hypothetical protein